MQKVLTTFLSAGQDGIILLGRAVLPVLFPFFVLTGLIINLFPCRSTWFVTTLAYFSGYPNGMRMTKTLYDQGQISLTQARHLAVITATPSPVFVIATVGTLLLQNTIMGMIIFICAVLGALINGLIWRKHDDSQIITPATMRQVHPSFYTAFSQSISSATSTVLNVCGVILFFYIMTRMLQLPPILSGIFEMTTGATRTQNPLLIQFFVSFGGLSVAMQNMLFTDTLGIKFPTYLVYKLSHGLISCGLLAGYLLFFN